MHCESKKIFKLKRILSYSVFSQIFLMLILLTTSPSIAGIKINRIEPPNWWIGMENNFLQIMVYGENLTEYNAKIDYPGVRLINITRIENPNYLFLNVEISENAEAGNLPIGLYQNNRKKKTIQYPLLKRKVPDNLRGFDNSDVIYLLMPDRFANGNPDNDNKPGMLEKAMRSNPDGRHGGDIAGIVQHLDYFNELGITALWINPLLENNQEKYSYHGYAISNFYKTDPRFGTNQDYFDLVELCHKKNIKVIQDQVFNHCGIGHWWMDDLPEHDWVHQHNEFTYSNFRVSTLVDPYASQADRTKMSTGWFDKNMPDMNQDNPLLATYLIQNSIWWIESADIDGIRVDTYPYPSQKMMSNWAKMIRQEYPDITLLGEIWVGTPSIVAKWEGACYDDTGIQSVFDFPMYDAIKFGINEEEAWNTGFMRFYDLLTQDFLYKDPFNHVIFVDNHDVERIYSTVGEDYQKLKTVLTYLLTIRGIPTIYYGTELLMAGAEHIGHGGMRKDFPGGWPDDSVNAFVENRRTAEQNKSFEFLSSLIKWRNKNPVIHSGKLTQFIPEDGVYVYFRENDEKTVMVILNKIDEERTLDTHRFAECLKDFSVANNVISGKVISDLEKLTIQPGEPIILEMILAE